MDDLNQKINFYQKRTFGENLTATFDFLKESWKSLFKLCLYILLPLSIVQGVFMNILYTNMMSGAMAGAMTGNPLGFLTPSVIMNYVLLMIFYFIGQSVLTAIVYTVMQKYRNDEQLETFAFADYKNAFLSFLKRSFILAFYLLAVLLGYILVVGSLGSLFPYLLLIIIPGSLILLVPLSLISPAYLLGEGSGANNALKQSFRFGFSTWGSLFLLLVILAILAGIMQAITYFPWYIAVMIKSVFSTGRLHSEIASNIGYDFLTYLLAAVQVFGAYLSGIFMFVGVAFHYFSVLEAKESVSVNSDIENFEQL